MGWLVMVYKNNPMIFSCYSPPLQKFLSTFGIFPFDEFKNLKNGNTCWLYEKTDNLSTYLTQWTNNKKQFAAK